PSYPVHRGVVARSSSPSPRLNSQKGLGREFPSGLIVLGRRIMTFSWLGMTLRGDGDGSLGLGAWVSRRVGVDARYSDYWLGPPGTFGCLSGDSVSSSYLHNRGALVHLEGM